MSDLKFKSYALTIRPTQGVTDNDVVKFSNWVRPRCEYYHIITEKDDECRHIHAALILKMEQNKSNLTTLLIRLFKDFTTEEKSVLRKGVKIMYNNDFITKYMDKNDSTVVIASCLPEISHLESYYPKTRPLQKGEKGSMNPYYKHLSELWYEHAPPQYEINTINARHFLFKMMYAIDAIKILKDDNTIKQTAKHLVRYLLKKDESTIELAPFETEE